MLAFILGGFLMVTFLMVAARRITALAGAFRLQSLFLFFYAFYMAFSQHHPELFVVSVLILALKVALIPSVILRIRRRISAEEDLGLLLNPQLSIFSALILAYLSYLFSRAAMPLADLAETAVFTSSIVALCVGSLIMVSRMKALAQVVGLLTIENAIFLAASAIAGGMPFFVEIALFFDIFVFVIIIEVFVYKVNRLFTHIDTSKMRSLKG